MDRSLVFTITMNVARTVGTALGSFAGNLAKVNRKVAGVNDQLAQVTRYRELKRELKTLRPQMRGTGTDALKARQAFREQATELRALSVEMAKAGIKAKQLAKHQRHLEAQATRLTAQNTALSKAHAARATRQAAFNDVGGLVASAATIVYPIKAAMDFESAFADVKKVVNFPTPEAPKELQKTILRMSGEIPVAAEGLSEIMAAGGQLGVKFGDLEGFTRTVAKMSTAFDMVPAEAGEAMAKLSNVYNIPMAEMSRLGDAINHLSDNTAAKAPDMVNTLGRIGGVAKQFGLTAVQAASLSNAFIALGKPPEVAGTAINAMLGKLQTADKQGPKFRKALASMGMDAQGLKDAIGQDAQGALTGFLESLESVEPTDRMGVLVDLFGSEFADDIALVVGSLDKYRDALTLTAKEQDYLGSMQKEFENRSKTTGSQLTMMKSKVNGVAIQFGSFFLPTLNVVIGAVGWLATKIADLSEAFPMTTSAIFGLVGGTLAAVAGFKLLKMATLFIGGGFKEMLYTAKAGAIGLAKGVMWAKNSTIGMAVASKAAAWASKVWAGAQWVLNAALNANPIGLIVVGVAALATGAYLLIKHWDHVSAFFSGLWKKLVAGFKWVWEQIKDMPLIGSVVSWFSGSEESGRKIPETMAKGIRARAEMPAQELNQALAKTAEYLPHSDAPRGPLSTLTASGMSIMTTMASGVLKGASSLATAMGQALTSGEASPSPSLALAALDAGQGRGASSAFPGSTRGGETYNISFGDIHVQGGADTARTIRTDLERELATLQRRAGQRSLSDAV